MGVFDKLNKKYNIEPEDNEPRMVYAPPEAMGISTEPLCTYESFTLEEINDLDLIDVLESQGNEVLFYYMTKPTQGLPGDDGGFSVTIYCNRNVSQKKYKYGDNMSFEEKNDYLSEEQMKALLDVYTEYMDDIVSFRRVLSKKKRKSEAAVVDSFKFGTLSMIGFDLEKEHTVWKIVNPILEMVCGKQTQSMHQKYDISPEKNTPQKVYGIPKHDDKEN